MASPAEVLAYTGVGFGVHEVTALRPLCFFAQAFPDLLPVEKFTFSSFFKENFISETGQTFQETAH